MPQNNSLMGFSVHQPAIGKSLQFFPALGSKQLDEMIDAYVPGDASISEKRAAVSLEFFEHTLATGELFKFFMVYPALGSTTESPVDSMVDSGYASNFTSPIMSERQWTQSSHCSPSLSESSARRSSYKKAASPTDFSHIPGMKILTRDGRDVTNSASRGCKTKEQRDHAHLMRIIKACESCRKKKVRCDPSHKRLAGTSVAKTAKKAKKPAAVSAPPPAPSQLELGTSLYAPSDSAPPIDLSLLSSSFDYLTPEPLGDGSIDWDEFIYYEEPMDTIPYDYNIFHPTNYLSPASYNSFLSSQPITPNSASSAKAAEGSAGGTATQDLLPPYLQPGGEIGTEYADFNLYSPGSSTCLDDDPGLAREVAATSRLEYSAHHYHQQPSNYYRQRSSPPSDGSPLSRFIADVPAGHILREETYSPTNLNSPQRLQISDRQASQISSDMPYGDSRLTRRIGGAKRLATVVDEPPWIRPCPIQPTNPTYPSNHCRCKQYIGIKSRFKSRSGEG
ncbi:hypothetical protein GGS23DRAFT_612860 [Durotheca rogersii]|uniref:uncharacterized protein n=1 Tax=Durotheca rogersii TaxID=419775 RepID=UPI002220FCF5|nr:uncharacterized protein GGS23DRAFT_612860 [Durotheca rogersii]KAI5867707.1 hypothetical protein GGS23DRAFT_612860 [Durotheca rogersii]